MVHRQTRHNYRVCLCHMSDTNVLFVHGVERGERRNDLKILVLLVLSVWGSRTMLPPPDQEYQECQDFGTFAHKVHAGLFARGFLGMLVGTHI